MRQWYTDSFPIRRSEENRVVWRRNRLMCRTFWLTPALDAEWNRSCKAPRRARDPSSQRSSSRRGEPGIFFLSFDAPLKLTALQQDHFGVFVEYKIPMGESLLSIEKQPWVFFIELFKWFIWGTGMLLAPVLQLAIFVFSSQLDDKGYPIPNKELNHKDVPDIEIMPVSQGPPSGTSFLMLFNDRWHTAPPTNLLTNPVVSLASFVSFCTPKVKGTYASPPATPKPHSRLTLDTSRTNKI